MLLNLLRGWVTSNPSGSPAACALIPPTPHLILSVMLHHAPFQHEVHLYIDKCRQRLVKLKGTTVSEMCSQLDQLIDNCFFTSPVSPALPSCSAVLVVVFSKLILLEDTKFERIIYNELRKMTNISLARNGHKHLCDAVNRIGNKRVRMSERAESTVQLQMEEDLKKEFEQLEKIIRSEKEPFFNEINVMELTEMVERLVKKEDFDQELDDFEVVAETESELVEDEFVMVNEA